MKPKLSFLIILPFLFLFSGSVYGQEEVKKKYWDNGKLKSETHYKNGQKDGLETWWYESGEKESEIHFKNGKPEGLATDYYESGEKKTKVHFKNGKLDGLLTEWYENGKKSSEQNYKDGKKNSLANWWDIDGVEIKWVSEQTESVGAVAYVYGRITYGDKHRIIIRDSKCHGGEQLFTFYTKKQNKDILNLEGKVVEIKYNQKIIRAKIITTREFILGHIAMFTLGGYSIAQLINLHEYLPYISIELIDSEQFKASDYFDVMKNKWSLKNFKQALIKAKSVCEKNKVSVPIKSIYCRRTNQFPISPPL